MPEIKNIIGQVNAAFLENLKQQEIADNLANKLNELITAEKRPTADELVTLFQEYLKGDQP